MLIAGVLAISFSGGSTPAAPGAPIQGAASTATPSPTPSPTETEGVQAPVPTSTDQPVVQQGLAGSRQEAREAVIQIYALGALGSVYEDLGEGLTPQVDQYHNQALELLEGPMGQAAGGMAWADLGFCLFERGDLDGAARLLQMGLSAPTPQGLINRPRFLIGLALVALENGQLDQASDLTEEVRQYVDERAMQNLYPETFLVVAKVTAARGELLEALEQCSQAEAMAEKMNMRPFVWKACLSAAQVYSELGQTDQARIKIEKARSIVSEIAGAFVDDDLRAEYVRTTNKILDAFHY